MYNYVQNNKRMKYNKNLLEKLKEFILTLVWTKESLTTIQSKYFINIFTYIVGQKCFLQFSSTVYYRVNEVWNMIYTNIPSCSAYNERIYFAYNFARAGEATYRAIDQLINSSTMI